MRLILRTTTIAAALLLTGLTATPASAHEAPTTGSTCPMAGQVEDHHGTLYLCTSKAPNAKPRWGKGLTQSTSPLTVVDGWAKSAASGMSAAFGLIKNPSSTPVRVIGATSPVSTVTQLHEVVMKEGSMTMQQKPRGFVIPARGTLELKPGGDHLMFMKLTKPLTAGSRIPVTLITADGGVLKTTVLVKVYAGANEDYDASTSTAMSGM